MKRTTSITAGITLGLLTLGACSSSISSGTRPATAEDYEDTAQAIASSVAGGNGGSTGIGTVGVGDVVAMADSMSISIGKLPGGFSRRNKSISGKRLGVDHTFTVVCKDAAGATLEECDDTTDAATVELALSGGFDLPFMKAQIEREGTWSITGLQSPTATFEGDSSFSLETEIKSIFRDGVTASFTFDAKASYDAVTIATAERQITGGSAKFEVKGQRTVTGVPTEDPPAPGSGSALAGGDGDGDRDGDGDGKGDGKGDGDGDGRGDGHGGKDDDGPLDPDELNKSFEVKAELTFHADQTATLVLDGTQTFTVDLKTGRVTKAPE